jgi:3'(2'), 5'-bisphosphate nucleotidase
VPAAASPADHELAGRAATETGRLLVALRAELQAGGDAAGATGDAGDRQAHLFLMDLLGREAPGDAILSEEGRDDLARLECARVWIIDPVDGTREFSEAGRTDWAVHVALAIDGVAVAGAVALPARELTLTTQPPPPPRREDDDDEIRILVSRTRPPHQARLVQEALGGRLVPMGSAGAKAMAVVLGEADVYAPRACTSAGSTAAPSGTTSPTPGCPTCSSAGLTWPTRCCGRSTADSGVPGLTVGDRPQRAQRAEIQAGFELRVAEQVALGRVAAEGLQPLELRRRLHPLAD